MKTSLLTALELCAIAALGVPFLGRPAQGAGAGAIETPTLDQTVTGIGLISGWNCTGKRIQIRIDDGDLRTAGAHTSREDTRSICGRADTGYGLLINYNVLEPGLHRLTAYADGAVFAVGDFNTITFGSKFLTGKSARYPLLNFPDVGQETIVAWSEEAQNFAVNGLGLAPTISGQYYGATIVRDCDGVRSAALATYSVDQAGPNLDITATYADGRTVSYHKIASSVVDVDGSVVASANAIGDFSFRVNGERLTGEAQPRFDDLCRETQIVAAK